MFFHYTVQYPNNFYETYREKILEIGFQDEIHPQLKGQKFLDVSYAVKEGLDIPKTISELKEYLNKIDDLRPDVKLTHYPQCCDSQFKNTVTKSPRR